MTNIHLNFIGPFTFTSGDRCIFQSSFEKSIGIYLWAIKQAEGDDYLIHYVGETKQLAKRHRTHIVGILGMDAGIFDVDKARHGILELTWAGLWREKGPDGPIKLLDAYQKHHTHVLKYLSAIDIFFAELDVDDRLRKHVEGCVGWNLRKKHPEHKSLYPDDNHIGTGKEKNNGHLLIRSTQKIRGLDETIEY